MRLIPNKLGGSTDSKTCDNILNFFKSDFQLQLTSSDLRKVDALRDFSPMNLPWFYLFRSMNLETTFSFLDSNASDLERLNLLRLDN